MDRTGRHRRARHLAKTRTAGGRRAKPRSSESRAVIRLAVCGAVFVVFVVIKLLFPEAMQNLAQSAKQLLGRDADFQAAFSAVGRAISGEEDVSDSLHDAFTAVFSPDDAINDDGAGSPICTPVHRDPFSFAVTLSRFAAFPLPRPKAAVTEQEIVLSTAEETAPAEEEDCPDDTATAAISYVYLTPPLPENASLELRNLGFDHTSPAVGSLTSSFGWREHPILGGERFHYGIDISGDTGDDIRAFADGTVYATGESSALGNYIMLQHKGGYVTLYAHCSVVTVTRGSVSMGDKIAEIGESGMATGPHLHFELHDGELYLNPIYYVEIS